jgi:cobalt-zinc-cadmium efflux system membrane fusion protein
MEVRIHIGKRFALLFGGAVAVAAVMVFVESGRSREQITSANAPLETSPGSSAHSSQATLELTSTQLNSIKVEPIGTYHFPVDREAVGSIDYDGDLSVQVFPTYQGTIIAALVQLGAEVHIDQPLYTIKSPDLIQAESTLIGAAATYELTNKELARVRGLAGIAEREREQAISDQETAEGALKAARDAVRVFGKTDAEIDQMIASRKIDPALMVRSPIPGKITSKNAQPGWLVQPGNLPAPYSVADVTIKWMLANVAESEIALFHLGEPVEVRVISYPERVFLGRVAKIYEYVDPGTHRGTVRSEIADPKDELHPGMLANFVIRVKAPVDATAIPANGVVREADGAMTVWVTTDRHRFVQKVVKVGLRKDGWVEILEGLRPGELAVTDGAVFLSNMLEAPPSD